MASRHLCISVPGKVLVSGGYLVLDQSNKGLVLGTTARFRTSIQWKECNEEQQRIVCVTSKQFEVTYEYQIIFKTQGNVAIKQINNDVEPNVYIETTLQWTLCYLSLDSSTWQQIWSTTNQLRIVLSADNDFYSQRNQLLKRNLAITRSNLASLPNCLPVTKSSEKRVAKTGMGSSASLIASLVGALVYFFRKGDDVVDTKRTVHNLAQVCHCVAQGKVGSGFDVSTAIFGSQFYSRFSPEILESVEISNVKTVVDNNELWNCSVAEFSLPKGMELMMGDVCNGGSETVSMVKSVLKWKNECEESNELWKGLVEANRCFQSLFIDLVAFAASAAEKYSSEIEALCKLPSSEWKQVENTSSCVPLLLSIRKAFLEIRRFYRDIGKAAGVPIEPETQKLLADETMDLPGVLIAGVPGAGGFDAIFTLVLHESALPAVEYAWESSSVVSCCPLVLSASSSDDRGLQVHPKS